MTFENTSADVCSGPMGKEYQENGMALGTGGDVAAIRAAVAAILSGDYDEEQYAEHVQTLAEARLSGCEILRLKHLGRGRRKSADPATAANTQ